MPTPERPEPGSEPLPEHLRYLARLVDEVGAAYAERRAELAQRIAERFNQVDGIEAWVTMPAPPGDQD